MQTRIAAYQKKRIAYQALAGRQETIVKQHEKKINPMHVAVWTLYLTDKVCSSTSTCPVAFYIKPYDGTC